MGVVGKGEEGFAGVVIGRSVKVCVIMSQTQREGRRG